MRFEQLRLENLRNIAALELDPGPSLNLFLGANGAGSGFYQLAKELRLLPMSASADKRFGFWVKQVKQLYERH